MEPINERVQTRSVSGLGESGVLNEFGSPECRAPGSIGQPSDNPVGNPEIAALRTAIEQRGILSLAFYFIDFVLRSQDVVFEQICSRKALDRMILALGTMTIALVGIYGLTMGMFNGPQQALSSSLKLPILFVMTGVICVPSLYVVNVLMGQRFRFLQTGALFMAAIGTTSILLGSLAPVAVFFTVTGASYPFLKLMHVGALGVCGVVGVQCLYRGCAFVANREGRSFRPGLFMVWLAFYSVVGMQLGWTLRPFVGAREFPFELVRSVGSNFYEAVLQSLADLVR